MKWLLAGVALCVAAPSLAQTAMPIPTSTVEIYRIAPGKQEAFLAFIAKADAINVSVGLPPRELYVHSDGASWDYLLIQPTEPPAEKLPALEKAWIAAGMPSGADFFFAVREFIADHDDTITKGPTTAAEFLATRVHK